MAAATESRTSPTLLGRIRQNPADSAAWNEFVGRYGRRIYAWCRQWKLQDADAHDVTQIVLLKLAFLMRSFAYDPARSFRGWLRTLTHHAWQDFKERQARAGAGSGDEKVWQLLQKLEAREDLMLRLEEEFDRELLEEAMARVQRRVEEQTWRAFVLVAIEGRSGNDAAAELGIAVTAVFVARHRVQKLIREEIAKLDEPPLPPP